MIQRMTHFRMGWGSFCHFILQGADRQSDDKTHQAAYHHLRKCMAMHFFDRLERESKPP
jgi:hypothetical protein